MKGIDLGGGRVIFRVTSSMATDGRFFLYIEISHNTSSLRACNGSCGWKSVIKNVLLLRVASPRSAPLDPPGVLDKG